MTFKKQDIPIDSDFWREEGKGQFLKYCHLIRWINVQFQVTRNQLWFLSTLEVPAWSGGICPWGAWWTGQCPPPGRCALLIPAACDHATSHGQRDTADVNKLKILSWRDGWAPVRQGSYKTEDRRLWYQRRRHAKRTKNQSDVAISLSTWVTSRNRTMNRLSPTVFRKAQPCTPILNSRSPELWDDKPAVFSATKSVAICCSSKRKLIQGSWACWAELESAGLL